MQKNSQFDIPNMEGVQIRDAGLKALVEGLKDNRTLTELKLHRTEILLLHY